MSQLNSYFASKLFQVKAIKFQPRNPFVWATGWNSPMYFDSRKLLSYPTIRNVAKIEMARIVLEQYPEAEVIAAVASNAIALGMLVAEELSLPFVYVHPAPKDHGFENMVEGDLRPRQNVVVIEDQVSVGRNSIRVVETIRKNGGKVPGVITLLDYGLQQAVDLYRDTKVELTALTNFETVLAHALTLGLLSETDTATLRKWHNMPDKWRP